MTNQKGQVLILTLIALGVVLFTVLFVIAGAQVYFQNTTYSVDAEKALALAEAGIDKALTSLNKTGGSYNGEPETAFGDGVYSVTVTNKDAGTKILQASGYIPNKTSPKVKRTITMAVTTGVGVAFVYGMQVGEGGIEMGNGAIINGSVYSNGNIAGGNNTRFTGDVWVAGAGQATADQQSDCFGVNCQDYIFGKNISGEGRQDVAQSFIPSADLFLNKISLKLKKIGFPSNPTVRIMSDASGKPNKNGVLATGTLSANLVTGEYGFVDITFDGTPSLDNDSTYWIMIHIPSLDSTNYWMWSLDLAQGYTNGMPKWSNNWQSGNPTWTSINGDLGFQTYMSGEPTSVNLTNGSIINGNVHAHIISGDMIISKDAYYQNIDPSTVVQGSQYPGSSDPPPAVFPISEANITDWKNQAVNGGVTNGDVSGCNMALGPGKIIGNLIIDNTCTITVKTPIWITGNITTGNSAKFILDSSYGGGSGVIVVDGKTIFGNGSDLRGSGTGGSYLMLLSTYDSRQNGETALDSGNSSVSGIIYAPQGKVELVNGASFKELTAWKIIFGTGATLTYDSGMASTVFSSGPSGSFTLLRGTYQVK